MNTLFSGDQKIYLKRSTPTPIFFWIVLDLQTFCETNQLASSQTHESLQKVLSLQYLLSANTVSISLFPLSCSSNSKDYQRAPGWEK